MLVAGTEIEQFLFDSRNTAPEKIWCQMHARWYHTRSRFWRWFYGADFCSVCRWLNNTQPIKFCQRTACYRDFLEGLAVVSTSLDEHDELTSSSLSAADCDGLSGADELRADPAAVSLW